MSEKGGTSLFNVTLSREFQLDPHDPRTWWAVEYQNRPDTLTVAAQIHDHAMFLGGVSARTYYFNAPASIKIGAAACAYYHFDSPSAGGDVYNYEAEALGQRMIYSDVAMPTIDFRQPLISQHEDLDRLHPPADWLEHGRVRYAWDIMKSSAELGINQGTFCAPFSLAVGLRSYPLLVRDMKRDPAFAHELFTRLVDEILPSYVRAEKDYCGMTQYYGADAWACYPNLSPEQLEEWVVPYSMRLLQNCMPYGVIALPVASGDYCEEDLGKFDKEILFKTFTGQIHNAAGNPAIFLGMGRWQDYPLEAVAEYLQPYKQQGIRAVISAGINARLLRDGPVDRIVDNVKRYIDVLARDHDITLFLANIPADTPSEHVHAAVAAVRTYGRLPIADNLDKVKFELPKRESFNEYVAAMSGGAGLGV
jgi:Uroporphyrinogen decarboxylase (URO-D)